MKVIIVHSNYRISGGEDAVVNAEKLILPDAKLWTHSNGAGLKAIFQLALSVYNPFIYLRFKRELLCNKPEIIHIHNLHFAIGPVVIRLAKKFGIPVVMTLHNFRLLCPSATLLHNGNLFTDSINLSFPWKAVFKKVYRGSFLQTFWLAFVIWVNKKLGTWQKVDRYIVLTEFSKDLFTKSSFGVSAEKFVVKPNFVSDINFNIQPRTKDFLFVGRLSEEKGIRILLEAVINTKISIRIAGDGPLKELVIKSAIIYPNIKYLGRLEAAEVYKEMYQCSVLVFPSVWYEGMPMTILEAFASGMPVIASSLGAMGSMIKDGNNGLHFQSGDANKLKQKLELWKSLSEEEKTMYRSNARKTYEEHYTPENNLKQLLAIYQSAINENKK